MDQAKVMDQYIKENPDTTIAQWLVFWKELSEEIAAILQANENIP